MRRLRYVIGVSGGISAGVLVGAFTGMLVFGGVVAAVVSLAAVYLMWETSTLGAGAAEVHGDDDESGDVPVYQGSKIDTGGFGA